MTQQLGHWNPTTQSPTTAVELQLRNMLQSVSERILKIGSEMTGLTPWVWCLPFYGTQCTLPSRALQLTCCLRRTSSYLFKLRLNRQSEGQHINYYTSRVFFKTPFHTCAANKKLYRHNFMNLSVKRRVAKCHVPLRPVIGQRQERGRIATPFN